MPNVNIPLSIAIYNSHGHGLDRLMYMNKLLKCIDILLIQEYWLLDSTIVKLERSLQGVYVHGVSGMRETEFRAGRPFGGVAILWKANIKCKISPVQLLSRRMCAISIVINGIHIVIYNCYMPR